MLLWQIFQKIKRIIILPQIRSYDLQSRICISNRQVKFHSRVAFDN